MDIQGAEIKALKGMSNILDKNNDIVLILEYWHYGIDKLRSNPNDLFHILNKRRFNIFDIEENKEEKRLSKVKSIVGLKKYHKFEGSTNMLCIRDESRITSFL